MLFRSRGWIIYQMLIKCGGYRLFKKRESLVPYSHFFLFPIVTTLVPPPFFRSGALLKKKNPLFIIYSTFSFFHLPPKDGGGIQRKKRASKGSSWVTEESSDCSVTESEGFLPLSLLSSTLGLIILLQQSKLRNESNGNLGLCPLGRFFFPLR